MSSFFDFDDPFFCTSEKKKESKKNIEENNSEYHQMSLFELMNAA